VFDDVHLMDEASADLLEQLCRKVSDRPWLLIVTRRDIDGGFAPSEAYDAVPLRPGPLDGAAATSLVEQALLDTPLAPHDVAALTARAGGNPLFLRGLALAARQGAPIDALPATVEALITSQIDRLPPDDRSVLRFASVLGVIFSETELRALLQGHAVPSGLAALPRLSYFIRGEGQGRYRFDHQLIRDTAYEGLPYRLRRDLHARAGEVLEATTADPADVAELLSLHFLHAARPDKAWHYSRVAGERAGGKYAYAQAEELLARAVLAARSVPELADHDVALVHLALGEARFRLGRNALALEAFKAARTRLRSDPVHAARVLKREADTRVRMGRLTAALGTVSRGLRLLDGLDDPASLIERSRLEGVYAVVRETQGRYRDALAWARAAQGHAEESGDTAALADALEAVHSAYSMLGVEPDQRYGERALALYERLADRAGQSRALNNLAVLAWMHGAGNEALEMFRRAEALASESGDTVGAAATRCNIGDVLVRLGRTDEAETLLRALVPVLQGLGAEDFQAAARRALGLALVLEGQHEQGHLQLERARSMLVELGEPAEVVETDAAIALALLSNGKHDAAAALADDAVLRATALDEGYLLPWLLRLHGAALSDAGHLDQAELTLARALDIADRHGRIERGFVLAELAQVARRRGDLIAAERRDVESDEAFDLMGFVGSRRYPRR
jgi:tetratricopeptide (TPR) repeat protein